MTYERNKLRLRSLIIRSGIRPMGFWILAVFLICTMLNRADAQDEQYSIGAPEPDYYTMSEPNQVMGNPGYGWTANIGHIAGQTIAREESISHLSLMPYMFLSNNGMLFGDARIYRTNTGGFGGFGGAGYRQYIEAWDRYFGVAFYYDRDDSRKTNEAFEGYTLSAETRGQNFDLSANFYLPEDVTRTLSLDVTPGSERFSGNFLVFGLTRTLGTTMKGVDMELGVPVRTGWAQQHNVRLHGGWYHFQNPDVDNIWGWKTKVSGELFNNLNLQAELTSDETFKTNVQLGVSYTFDPGNLTATAKAKTTRDRMLDQVNRLYTIVVSEEVISEPDNIAINPDTGSPYFFRHVNSTVVGPGTGTFEDPFQQILVAQTNNTAAPADDLLYDVIFVHADSTFDAANAQIVTDANKIMFGEANGVTHVLPVAGVGNVVLPRATTGTNRPLLTNSPGDGVVLNSGSTFSGFDIRTPAGRGLFASGTTGGTARNLDVIDPGLQGYLIEAPTGTFVFDNNVIRDTISPNIANSNAFEVNNGNASISYNNGEITNIGGRAVIVNGTTGGFVNLLTSTITDTAGEGILINNTAGSVTIDDSTILNSTTTGVDIQGALGNVTFVNNTNITGAFGVGFNAQNTGPNSRVLVNNLTVSDRNDTGVNLTGIGGEFEATGDINITNVVGVTATPGLNIQNSAGNFTMGNVAVVGSNGVGIAIGEVGTDNTGVITSDGVVSVNNATGDSLLITDDMSTILFSGSVNIDNRGGRGVVVENNNGSVSLGNTVTVSNTTNSAASAIDVNGNTETVTFGDTTATDTTGNPGVNVANNTNNVSFNSLNITSNNGDGLFAIDNFNLQISGGTINSVNGTAVDIIRTPMEIAFESISNSNADHGIFILNSPGTFAVTGGATAGSGGTLTGNSIAGIFLNDAGNLNVETISSAFQNINNNLVNVSATSTDTLTIDNASITNSTQHGIDLLNVAAFNLTNSSLQFNGGVGFQTLRSQVNIALNAANDPYIWTLDNNVFLETDGDVINFNTLVGGEGANVAYLIDGNTITQQGSGLDGVTTTLNGIVEGNLINNTVTINPIAGANGFGFNLQHLSLSDNTTLLIDTNTMTLNGLANTAVSIQANSSSTIELDDNAVSMTGGSNTGFIFNLADNANVIITDNFVQELTEAGTGMLFQLVNGTSSTFQIDNNTIELTDTTLGGIQERGIIFAAVNNPTITLNGTVSNTITIINPDGFEQLFFIPANTSTGSLIINDVTVP